MKIFLQKISFAKIRYFNDFLNLFHFFFLSILIFYLVEVDQRHSNVHEECQKVATPRSVTYIRHLLHVAMVIKHFHFTATHAYFYIISFGRHLFKISLRYVYSRKKFHFICILLCSYSNWENVAYFFSTLVKIYLYYRSSCNFIYINISFFVSESSE